MDIVTVKAGLIPGLHEEISFNVAQHFSENPTADRDKFPRVVNALRKIPSFTDPEKAMFPYGSDIAIGLYGRIAKIENGVVLTVNGEKASPWDKLANGDVISVIRPLACETQMHCPNCEHPMAP